MGLLNDLLKITWSSWLILVSWSSFQWSKRNEMTPLHTFWSAPHDKEGISFLSDGKRAPVLNGIRSENSLRKNNVTYREMGLK